MRQESANCANVKRVGSAVNEGSKRLKISLAAASSACLTLAQPEGWAFLEPGTATG